MNAPRPPDYRDLALEAAADEWATADARALQALIEGESYRMCWRAALDKIAEDGKRLKAQDATISHLRAELRRYTAAVVGGTR